MAGIQLEVIHVEEVVNVCSILLSVSGASLKNERVQAERVQVLVNPAIVLLH